MNARVLPKITVLSHNHGFCPILSHNHGFLSHNQGCFMFSVFLSGSPLLVPSLHLHNRGIKIVVSDANEFILQLFCNKDHDITRHQVRETGNKSC